MENFTEKYGKYKVERIESTFEDIIEQNEAKGSVSTAHQDEQLDLFALDEEQEDTEEIPKLRYKVVDLLDIGQQIVEEIE